MENFLQGQKRLIHVLFSKLLLLLACTLVSAASPDSLLRALEAHPEASLERAEILYQLGLSNMGQSPSETIRYGNALIKVGQESGSLEYEFLGCQLAGIGQTTSEGLDEGLALFQRALDIASRFDTPDWKRRQVKARVNIAGVYWNQKNPTAAYPYNHQNINDAQQLGDSLLLADTYQSMALMLQLEQCYDSSMIYSQRAIALYEILDLLSKKSSAQLTMGNTLLGMGRASEALQLLLKTLEAAEAENWSSISIGVCAGIAKAYLALGDLAQAEVYARKSLKQVAESEILSLQVQGHEAMYEFYLATSRYDSALYYYQTIAGIKERILNEQKAKRIQELEISYQTRQKEQEIISLKQTNIVTQRLNRIFGLSLALLAAIIILTTFFYYRLQRRKTQLESLHWEAANLNARLLTLMDEKKHVIGLITHDIRTPLSLIQLNTYLLAQSNGLDEEERRQVIQEIGQATDEINAAGLKIMELENKTLEKEYLSEELLEAAPLIEHVALEFQAHARSKSIDLITILPSERVLIFGDRFLLRHILANLLSNAIKFSPPQGKVEIRLKVMAYKVIFQVADQGPGLSEEVQQQLFKKKTNPLHPPASQQGAWGQGLYLANRFVQAMGGQLSVESKPGEGATFSVSLPSTS
jgi:signal transduction histidine kinase